MDRVAASRTEPYRVLQQTVHLLDRKAHGETLEQQAETSGWHPSGAGSKRLGVVDPIVDLIDYFVVCFELATRQN